MNIVKEQNLKSHRQLTFWYHGALFAVTISALVHSIVAFVMLLRHGGNAPLVSAVLLACIALTIIYVIMRHFAVKLQDRTIRTEENVRYFALAGKLLPSEVTLGQIVALRFASDHEFIGLVDQAVKEKLTKQQIKELIKDWRADYYRV